MKNVTTAGLVIKQQVISEKDKLLTILTREYGVIYAFARGAKQMKNKLFSASQMYSYSRFDIYKSRDKYIVDSAELISSFGGLHTDIAKLSLAHYFSDITLQIIPRELDSGDHLRLFLNSLYFISEGTKNLYLIKSIFEMRSISQAGFMPDLTECAECGAELSDSALFENRMGLVFCKKCGLIRKTELLDGIILKALRHICYSDFERLFSFSISDEAAFILSDITERYLEAQVGRLFKTLEFFKTISDK